MSGVRQTSRNGKWHQQRLFSAVLPVAITAALIGITPAARAGNISYVDQFKNVGSLQTANGNALSPNGAFYSADINAAVDNAYTSASLTYPGPGSPVSLTLGSSTTDYQYQTSSFATQAAMDAAFPFGAYTFQGVMSGGGTDTAGFTYMTDDYAQSNPYLTGTDYADLQGMDPSKAFTFHLSPYTTGGTANLSHFSYDLRPNDEYVRV